MKTPQKLLYAAERSVDKALQFYADNRVPLSYRPRLKYVDDHRVDHEQNNYALSVAGEHVELRELANASSIGSRKRLYLNEYGLVVSDAAIEQSRSVGNKSTVVDSKERIDEEAVLFADADIAVYPPCLRISSWHLDHFIAHELWHLKEKEHGVMMSSPFIKEGTATYAASVFSQMRYLPRFDDLRTSNYVGAAYVVSRHVDHLDRPLEALLDLSVRSCAQREFLDISGENMHKLVNKFIAESESVRNMVKGQLLSIFPSVSALEGNVTKQSVLSFFRSIGETLLADELESQDTSKLLDYYKRLGF